MFEGYVWFAMRQDIYVHGLRQTVIEWRKGQVHTEIKF